MLEQKPTWIKSALIFSVLIVVPIGILYIGSIGKESEGTLEVTKQAIENLKNNNFTQTGSATIPPIDPDADWLNDSADDPYIGPKDAAIVIMEFSDFECPFCGNSFPAIREITAKHDNVKYIYRDYPVDELHPEARMAAEAAGCAHDQDLFWPYHDRLFQNQHNLSRAALFTYARQTGLDMLAFTECFEEKKFAAEVEQDRLIGVNLGVRGTPTWFINGEKVEGAIDIEGWSALFESL